ncbi:MAG TPA: uroporphyrinogen-III synthase [Candidatus Binatia bacterium]|nr:uroporphyrinogen-III synthase [Candidatus Binatia bacterium]
MNHNIAPAPRDQLPLAGKRIVITRARAQAGRLARAIEQLGGEAIEFPTIAIKPAVDLGGLDDAIKNFYRYDWLIFTSANAAKIFFERMAQLSANSRQLTTTQIAAIGPETAKVVKAAGVENCLVPSTYRAEGILDMLRPTSMQHKRVLIPRAAKAREVLPETLRRWGAQVDVIEAYCTVLPKSDAGKLQAALERGEIDMITFTSSSTVANFAQIFDGRSLTDILGETPIACIGPITESTVRDLGGVAAVTAGEFTIEGLVHAIVDYLSEKRRRLDAALGVKPERTAE